MDDKEIFQKLVYGISHDLGAPLRSVVRFSEMLETKLGDRLDEREAHWFKFVVEGGKQAQSMLEALLKYSRLATRQGDLVALDLNELITHVVTELKAQHHAATKTEFVIEELPVINAYYSHMEVLFYALMENAVLFHKKASSQRKVSLAYKLDGTTHEFTIEDNGIGVRNSQIKQMARPYWRGNSDSDFPGLGMGLAYCERVLQLAEGELAFEQVQKDGENLGLRVKVRLPSK